MGHIGKIIGGLFGGIPGGIVGDVIDDALKRTSNETIKEPKRPHVSSDIHVKDDTISNGINVLVKPTILVGKNPKVSQVAKIVRDQYDSIKISFRPYN